LARLLRRSLASRTTVLVLLALAPGPALAQRSFSWDEVSVEARLDADGRLHVRETQVLVMSGDWNGGERRFALEPGQRIELHGVARVDPSTGEAVPLRRGGLHAVDHFDWTDATTLRWRSRLPTDPPFRDARLTYVLDYTCVNVLQPRGGDRYELDHDFLFADRPGVIRRFTLTLTLHPDWKPLGPVATC